ncbi:MAG: bifunctional methylenetetrahydrofolate dehydrogenase/methenyltetrahydrofolate cyclohydrolase FolD [Burkholderiaceae bacterium]|jgi:methylenetetrahydrofolate dehydrogenase (NADP+)/methenyltetrahydrofolate cyclohydrolase|nr:bifunctional methylenetetrahydrofolate dehydrogenase/methenyltetrahydrofolate cyclohydrolase FolD [Burkholderiaceae bacterium]
MTAEIINGNKLAQALRAEVAERAAQLCEQGEKPGLAVILVGDSPASMVYVMNKEKASKAIGIHSVLEKYEEDLTEAALLERIRALNVDPRIHGILVQLPLPPHINTHRVIETIAPEKDMDCFHVVNAGMLMTGMPRIRPCTPYGVMKMLESIQYPVVGSHAVVVGASNIVGKPMAMMLLQAGATVTICNSKTRDLGHHTRLADILISATGQRHIIKGGMVKPGAVVIDVGVERDKDGKLWSDVEFDSVREVAGYLSPVPGGVGPMTITMLLVNTIEAAEKALQAKRVAS